MKPIAVALPLMLAGCSSETITNFAGTYTGTLSESYTCPSTGPSYALTNQSVTVTQLGTDVFVALASCAGSDIAGDAFANAVTLSSAASVSCAQDFDTDAGMQSLEVTGFSSGGTLTLDNSGNLEVSLPQTATFGTESCTGTATGTLSLQ